MSESECNCATGVRTSLQRFCSPALKALHFVWEMRRIQREREREREREQKREREGGMQKEKEYKNPRKLKCVKL